MMGWAFERSRRRGGRYACDISDSVLNRFFASFSHLFFVLFAQAKND
jgi:hypothetical protein